MPADALKTDRSKPSKFVFSAAKLSALKPPAKGRKYYYDAKQGGLSLCVTSAGAKTYYVYRKIEGRPERIRLGRFKDLTITQARGIAQAIVGSIAQGENPVEERKQARGVPALGVLFAEWLEVHAKHHRRTWKEDKRGFDKYLAGFHGRPLNRITPGDVAEWHGRTGKEHGPIQANRVLGLLSTLFNWSPKMGYEGKNPCIGVKRFREHSRDRFLVPAETRRFFEAVNEQPPKWRDYFLLLLFTGVRKSNLSSMAWADVDFEGRTWRVPHTKNDQPTFVPLTPPALRILEARLQEVRNSPWVFPGRTGHVKDARKAWTRVLKAAGIADLHLHDLRRSLGSWQAALGSSLAVIGASLGHRDLKSTQIYSRLTIDPVRTSVTNAVTAMLEAAKPEESPEGQGGVGDEQ